MADEKEESYQLKDKETSFYDDETALEVTRDQVVKIGPGRGKKTVQMIKSGGLLKVDSSAAEAGAKSNGGGGAKGSSTAPKTGPITEEFPHAKVLADNKVTTFEHLHKLNKKQLIDLTGIGEKKVEEIETALGR